MATTGESKQRESQYAGLTESVFGSGVSYAERCGGDSPAKGGTGASSAKGSSSASKSSSKGKGSGTPAGSGTGSGDGGDGKKRKKKKKRRRSSAAAGRAVSPEPEAEAGSSQGSGSSTPANSRAGSKPAGSPQSAGAGSGAGSGTVRPQKGAKNSASGTSGAVPTVKHVPQPSNPGDVSATVMHFGERLKRELEHGTPSLEGYLFKLGGVSLGLRIFKRWTSRYFVLCGPYLQYWENKGDRESGANTMRYQYELDGASVDSVRVPDAPHPYAVELVTREGTREYLVAEQQEHANMWAEAIGAVIGTLGSFPAPHLATSSTRGKLEIPTSSAPLLANDSGSGSLEDEVGTTYGSLVERSPHASGRSQRDIGSASVVSDTHSMQTVAVAVPVAVDAPPPPSPAVATDPVVEEKACHNCHNVLEEGDMFCDNCGTRVG